jgi:hypothetical protein
MGDEDDYGRELWEGTVRHVRDDVRLRRASEADRLALARELLAGTGRVVARVPDAQPVGDVDDTGYDWNDGWNACRAAMMGEGDAE